MAERHIAVKSRSKNLKDVKIEWNDGDGLVYEAVLKKISSGNRGINTNRLRLTYLKEGKHVPLAASDFEGKNIESLESHAEWYVKDLGPQISWRLVFVVEYLGPILIHSAVYYLSLQPQMVAKYHSSSVRYNEFFNTFVYRLIMAHYLKREFETIFVHSFSSATMPLFNIFKNSFHYWVLNGLISLGYFGYGFPVGNKTLFRIYSKLRISDFRWLVGLFALSEVLNFYIHVQLRRWGDLQKKNGVTARVPLESGLFKYFVAPNYTFESWAWIWFTLIFKLNIFSVVFLVVSVVQMYVWAQKKNKKYGTKRAFLIPYVF